MSRSQLKCVNYSMFRPGRTWDEHDLCPKCHTFTRRDPCLVCIQFTPSQWLAIDTWLTGQRNRLQDKLDLVPNPSGSLVEGELEQLGEEEEGVVEESGQQRAEEEIEKEREREKERWREKESARSRRHRSDFGQGKGKAPAKNKLHTKKSGTVSLERESQALSQRCTPTERQVPQALEI
ncbi:hypothetical protein BSL78_12227 [Apostichopus japonicus]|uniref:Uncharacterized protein n=1 Tax=Stichopus japonicus TaxID=307972 RepID=A0A2G8KS93_STIJA|nr:hypothetical protein BSL78_12227 [Apostichopus japonicus]